MNSKERILTTLAHQEPDRVPIDYFCNPGIDARLKNHFGLSPDDNEGLRQALQVDFRYVGAPYVGPALHAPLPDRKIDLWGFRTRWIEHASGGYWDYCDFPLANASVEEILAWPMPDPNHFDYEKVKLDCQRFRDYGVVVGDPGYGDIINSSGMIRTMEQVMLDLAMEAEELFAFIDRKLAVQLEVLSRCLEVTNGGIDLMYLGEDLGTQIGPLISLDMYRRLLRPRHQKFVDLAKAHNIPVMIHSCGSSSWAFDDFVDMGITIVDTLQPEAARMQPTYLKERYGRNLSFHGMISTAGPVAYGSPEEVIRNVRETLDVMMPGGGYCLAPTHQLQDNSPTENVVALYETAQSYGRYGIKV